MTAPGDSGGPIPYRHLDPGVRELVRALAGHGFTPTDSGDGVSKPDVGRVFDFLYVAMVTHPAELADEADRLHGLLPTFGPAGLVVEGSYNPGDGQAILLLFAPPADDSNREQG